MGSSPIEGTIYLIHFDQPYKHARHYIGWAKRLQPRIQHHKNNTGARLLQVINGANISWSVVRTWKGNRHLERALKNRHNTRLLCPICKEIRGTTTSVTTATATTN